MSRALLEQLAVGLALLVVAGFAAIARAPVLDALAAPGAPAAQRRLAGGTAGVNPRIARPLRVVVLDGLNRADVPRLPALAALCARGAAVTVDVGFPTKSLAVQRALWSGLTAQQTGDGYDNEPAAAPPSSLPLLVPGAVAVVESHAVIARSVGFGVVLPPPEADAVDPLAIPAQVAAWQGGQFVTAARDAVASPAPLALVHVLAIDAAAHRGGRGTRDHADALAAADAVLGAVVDAAPDAQWLVLADHGHVAAGGHGDVEDAVRRVRACWSPAPSGATDGEVHLVDVARWLADAAGAPRDPRAVGRTLVVALAHRDPDATLPRPSWAARVAALLLVIGGVVVSVRGVVALRGVAWAAAIAWPVVTAGLLVALDGVPSLSNRPPLWALATATILPCGLVLGVGRQVSAGARWGKYVLLPIVTVALAVAVLSGVIGAIAGGPPPRMPWWTGVLGAIGTVTAIAIGTTGAFLVGKTVWDILRRRPDYRTTPSG